MSTLNCLAVPPKGLFNTPADELTEKLPGPTLLRLPGMRNPPVFISVLLHGNETSGWDALCRLLVNTPKLPRSIVLFIGNIAAAALAVRSLPSQQDYNRIWEADSAQHPLAEALTKELAAQPLLAALDLHNNTGRNPHYSVLTEVTPQTLGLAELFSEQAVLVEEPNTVLTRTAARFCPATTVELGPVGDPASSERAHELLRTYLELDAVPEGTLQDLRLYRALARIHVADGTTFGFADDADVNGLAQKDLVLTAGMEAVNFHSIPAGMEFAFVRKPLGQALRVLDPQHRDVTTDFLEELHGDVSLARGVIPAMYTTDPEVIQQDCLCYLMEQLTA